MKNKNMLLVLLVLQGFLASCSSTKTTSPAGLPDKTTAKTTTVQSSLEVFTVVTNRVDDLLANPVFKKSGTRKDIINTLGTASRVVGGSVSGGLNGEASVEQQINTLSSGLVVAVKQPLPMGTIDVGGDGAVNFTALIPKHDSPRLAHVQPGKSRAFVLRSEKDGNGIGSIMVLIATPSVSPFWNQSHNSLTNH